MTADQAFDNLMRQNAFPIPKGNRDGAESVPEAPAAMRVSEVFDNGGDYHPPRAQDTPAQRRSSQSPTETDLEPVDAESFDGMGGMDDANGVEAAARRGAKVYGRDAVIDPASDTVAGFDDEDVDDAEPESEEGVRARRLRRFSYLPLGGMEAFEAGARDLAIRLAAGNPGKPSLAITSAVRGEGRTEIAIRLALAIAKRVGSRVLLADFDIQHPQVAPRLGISTKYFALKDVLGRACPLSEAVVVSGEDNLSVLPSRVADREGDEILDGRHVAQLLEEMHESYDFIVIDCGPASQASALMVCREAGATALAGFCRFSRAGAMNEAAKRLAAAGANMAGMILAGDPA